MFHLRVYLYCVCAWCPKGVGEGVGAPGIMGHYVGAGDRAWVLEEQPLSRLSSPLLLAFNTFVFLSVHVSVFETGSHFVNLSGLELPKSHLPGPLTWRT